MCKTLMCTLEDFSAMRHVDPEDRARPYPSQHTCSRPPNHAHFADPTPWSTSHRYSYPSVDTEFVSSLAHSIYSSSGVLRLGSVGHLLCVLARAQLTTCTSQPKYLFCVFMQPSKLHLPSMLNERHMTRGEGVRSALVASDPGVVPLSQYGSVHGALGRARGPGVQRDATVRRAYNVLTGARLSCARIERRFLPTQNQKKQDDTDIPETVRIVTIPVIFACCSATSMPRPLPRPTGCVHNLNTPACQHLKPLIFAVMQQEKTLDQPGRRTTGELPADNRNMVLSLPEWRRGV